MTELRKNPYITDAYDNDVMELGREMRQCLSDAAHFTELHRKRDFAQAALYYMQKLMDKGYV